MPGRQLRRCRAERRYVRFPEASTRIRISRLRLINFANYRDLDITSGDPTGDHIGGVGESKVNQSNFIHSLRIVLDLTLPERVGAIRQGAVS